VERRNLVDAGPIIALLIAGDEHHAWAREVWAQLEPPVHTCEAVLSEAQHVVERLGGNPLAVLEFVRGGAINVAFNVEDEVERLLELQRTYADVPMSLADACLVRMTELHGQSRVLTTDSDFRIYRRNRRQIIPLLTPPGFGRP
jgi:predicted nucleic acid-binding protein